MSRANPSFIDSIILIIYLTALHKLIQGIGRIEDENISSGF